MATDTDTKGKSKSTMTPEQQAAFDADEAKRIAAEAKAKAKADAAEAKAKERAAAAEAKAAERAIAEQEKIDAIVKEEGIDLSTITGTGTDGKITRKDVNEAVKAKRAAERAARPKKAPMTLSQRRAMLVLMDGPYVPKNGFNDTPYRYLESVGLAQSEEILVDQPYTETVAKEVEIPEAERVEDGPTTKTTKEKVTKTRSVAAKQYSLTDPLGVERAKEVNPKWKDWRAPSTASADSTSAEAPAVA